MPKHRYLRRFCTTACRYAHELGFYCYSVFVLTTVITTQTALEALGLHSVPSSQAELRSAYRHRAKMCHPDAGGDDDSFMFLRESFEFLSQVIERGEQDVASVDLLVVSETATRITLNAIYMCPSCSESPKREQCPECHGWGGSCSTCRGVKTVPVKCPYCNGTKLISREIDVEKGELEAGTVEIDGRRFTINSLRR